MQTRHFSTHSALRQRCCVDRITKRRSLISYVHAMGRRAILGLPPKPDHIGSTTTEVASVEISPGLSNQIMIMYKPVTVQWPATCTRFRPSLNGFLQSCFTQNSILVVRPHESSLIKRCNCHIISSQDVLHDRIAHPCLLAHKASKKL